MNFDALPLDPLLAQAAKACGYESLTQVQAKVIPTALAGRDLMACAQTGTGKTAAFSFVLLQRLLNQPRDNGQLSALILTPTRELAIQVADSISRYSQFTELTTLAVYGGANINPQRKALARGVDILVATPGRLFDLLGQHDLSLQTVDQLIVDEADRMLDMGFVRDIERTKRLLCVSHSTMLFSATFTPEVKTLATKMLDNPEWINVTSANSGPQIEQKVYSLDARRKAELLAELIGRNNWQQVLVFVNTKESAERLHRELKLDGIKNAVFHGDKTQGARNRALEQFKAGDLRVLVATDVAARGLDITALPLVINLELPDEPQDYVHRIGRTGRAGLSGVSISFVAKQDETALEAIEALIGKTLPREVQPGYELGAPLPARYRELDTRVTSKAAQPKHGKGQKFGGQDNRRGQSRTKAPQRKASSDKAGSNKARRPSSDKGFRGKR
ncbi:DEAD/DEAH box helicase [Shewanella sp. KCT]|uniref:DEAD/DEAH box helicase n=1 Tax=Shewanella sp. KCT TaxID=2569535 RepID=UPI001181FB83|nr:DEAD/DEAH box helicase [Shewanella sp. KCT]TVP11470.1 RNA helicase [Shewanella sp. KCT]